MNQKSDIYKTIHEINPLDRIIVNNVERVVFDVLISSEGGSLLFCTGGGELVDSEDQFRLVRNELTFNRKS